MGFVLAALGLLNLYLTIVVFQQVSAVVAVCCLWPDLKQGLA